MRRLMFVDDEVPILRALERMLRAHRRDWECHFVDDPIRALDLLDEVQPDAVVSDMLMPGIDGAEFLTEAARRQPLMARFILSGEVGTGSLVRMARAAHQCLAKPCRGDVLMDVLRRAFVEASTVREPRVLEVLYGLSSLPVSVPRFDAVRRLFAQPSADARDSEAVGLIARSAGLATKVMQVATWTRLGMGLPPAHVHDAYFHLGPDAVCGLLDSDLLRPVSGAATTPSLREIWRRGERASAVGHALARAHGRSIDDARHVALVSLWGATAPALFDLACPDVYAAVRAEAAATQTPLGEVERRVFGLTARAAFAQLLRLWGLPSALADDVGHDDGLEALDGPAPGLRALAQMTHVLVGLLDEHAAADANAAVLFAQGGADGLGRWRQLAIDATAPLAA